jgi:tripeptide aminopeptidase
MNPVLQLDATRNAAEVIETTDGRTLDEQIELSEIPAPPFGESRRGTRMAELMAAAGLAGPKADSVGNVLARRVGTSDLPPLVISAHLDTVFPAETDVSVTREGDLLRGPGISDDARGLATMLSLARALEEASIRTELPILFAATVGEEGLGDLRGMKHLFGNDGEARDAGGFISLDGAGLDRVVVHGLGSRRFRVTVLGPGGHSWVDWGTVNPIHALTEVGHRLTDLKLSNDPRSTLTVARIGGGKSINAIPQEAWLEVDTRCRDNAVLAELERRFRTAVADVASDLGGGGRSSGEGALTFEVAVIGDRPGGSTAVETTLVQAALSSTRVLDREPVLATSSTDANIPMGLGIPAITLGCGGEAGQAHTTDEWYRNVRGTDGIIRALYTVLLTAGVATPE